VKKIVLMGNPNVGKSALFSCLTGARVIISNYPGSTVEFTRGTLKRAGGAGAQVWDAPGTYSLEPCCKAEEVARDLLDRADLVVNVVDATNLERNLCLTLQILETGIPTVVALNLWDEARHKGIEVDCAALERELGVPVIPTVAHACEGVRRLADRFDEARRLPPRPRSPDERWADVGRIVAACATMSHRHHTFLELLQDASLKPATGLPIAAIALAAAFALVRLVGEGLVQYACSPFFERAYLPFVLALDRALGHEGIVRGLLIGKEAGGVVDLEASMGVLTTGVYVAFGVVLPYIVAFYLVLGFMEDCGYLPRLAVLLDRAMHRVGLHGYAMLPMVLGFGCNVPGVLAARNLETVRERFIAITLMSVAVPCAAQMAMIVGLVGRHGGAHLAVVFSTLFALWVLLGIALDRLVPGHTPSILVEIPPYRIPTVKAQLKKLWMRASAFFTDALVYILGGVLLANLLYTLGVVEVLGSVAAPVVAGVLGLPQDAVSTFLIGFLRKDVAVAMLEPLDLSAKQLVVGATVLAAYFPCAATFAVLFRELGAARLAAASAVMVSAALAAGAALNLLLDAVLPAPALAAAIAGGAVLAGVLASGASEVREDLDGEGTT